MTPSGTSLFAYLLCSCQYGIMLAMLAIVSLASFHQITLLAVPQIVFLD